MTVMRPMVNLLTETNENGKVRTQSLGFTLLEMIIALALVSMMMLIAWSLFGIYAKLEKTGNRTATELQLVRSLMRQLQSDLQHVVMPGTRPRRNLPSPGSSSPDGNLDAPAPDAQLELAHEATLVGFATKLSLLVRPPVTADFGDPSWNAADEGGPVGIYQVVTYDWRAEHMSGLRTLQVQVTTPSGQGAAPSGRPLEFHEADVTRHTGLTRLARPWFQRLAGHRGPFTFPPAHSNGIESSNPSTAAVSGGILHAPSSTETLSTETLSTATRPPRDFSFTAAARRPQVQLDSVPEMTRLQFRFFGGNGWLDQWDSRSSGELPLAVEVAFDLDPGSAARSHHIVEDRTTAPTELHSDDAPPQAHRERLPSEARFEVRSLDHPDVEQTEYRYVIAIDAATSGSRFEEVLVP